MNMIAYETIETKKMHHVKKKLGNARRCMTFPVRLNPCWPDACLYSLLCSHKIQFWRSCKCYIFKTHQFMATASLLMQCISIILVDISTGTAHDQVGYLSTGDWLFIKTQRDMHHRSPHTKWSRWPVSTRSLRLYEIGDLYGRSPL